HHPRWAHDECVTGIWAGKVIDANWKAVSEAFMEAWHSLTTHRQILNFTGDANSKYNIYGEHVNLALTPFGVPSPHLGSKALPENELLEHMLKYNGRAAVPGMVVTIPP